MQTTPAYLGWGTHDFDDAPVFLMQLPKDPEVYDFEFYVDTDDGEEKLHHRMVDREVDEPAFTHTMDDEYGEALMTLLLRHQSYWLGFTDVEGDGIEGNVTMVDGPPTPEDGLFIQKKIRKPVLKQLAAIAKILYVDEDNDDTGTNSDE